MTTMTETRRAQLIIGVDALGASGLRRRFSVDELIELLVEETCRCRRDGVSTWAGYRSLARTGSTISLGGREKKSIFTALSVVGLI